MLKLSASLFNQPVMSLRIGGQVATASAPIINPHNLKILGWWCKAPRSAEALVLLTEDVRQELPDGLAIDDDDDLNLPEDLVRHREILDIKFQLIDKPVRTKQTRLGKVKDYSYNDGMFIQKLYVERPLRKILSSDDTLLIDRTQVLEVTDQYILVRDGELKASDKEFAAEALPAV